MRKNTGRLYTFIFFISILLITGCLAKDSPVSDSEYSFQVEYSQTICPGDPVFISLSCSDYFCDIFREATVTLYQLVDDTQKKVHQEQLITVRQNPPVLFAEMPTSTWAVPGEYLLEVTCNRDTDDNQNFILPVTMDSKEFVSETLYLNAQNTAIKTDNSKARNTQIDTLNEILFTSNPNAIYYDGTFIEPCESRRYTSFFGDRRVYQYNTGAKSTSLHYGVDYGVPVGTDVWACGAGKVVMAENRISTGWSVVIEHLPGLYSLYYHMDSLSVEPGQMVKKGEEIGKSGCTGLATGPHLHWEVRLAAEAVNPHFFVENQLF